MVEIVKTYKSMEEYIRETQQSMIDQVYKEAVDGAIGKEVTEEMIAEAFTKMADAEAELSILEDLFIQGKVDKKEVAQAKRRHTKAVKTLESLYADKEG